MVTVRLSVCLLCRRRVCQGWLLRAGLWQTPPSAGPQGLCTAAAPEMCARPLPAWGTHTQVELSTATAEAPGWAGGAPGSEDPQALLQNLCCSLLA